MFDQELVKNKLNQIFEYMDELEQIIAMPDDKIKKDYFVYHTAERLLQLIVDTMTDINMHFIKEKQLNVPDDLQSTFRILAANGILPDDFAEKIAPVVGMRNLLVHRYEKLDRDLFVRKLKQNFLDFKQYTIFIEQALS
jgi:uncharacterized protein YutE (UPF0331/DUF86 family)